MENRAIAIDRAFVERVSTGDLPQLAEPSLDTEATNPFDPSLLLDLFQTQLITRHLDLEARNLRAKGQGFYTIASSGHEGVAALGHVFHQNDMAFLHYRSTALLVQRARDAGNKNIIQDLLLSFLAAKSDPVSGGRHKVLGSKSLFIPPQTSTVASHLPKAVGAAYSIPLAKTFTRSHLAGDHELAPDSVVLCSFGDASVNHSTAQGAFNFSSWLAFQHMPLPLVFICEDNGIGISTPTPESWIESAFSNKAGFKYIAANGLDLLDVMRAAKEADHWARSLKVPVFLHVKLVRLLAHAGSDVETSYHSEGQILTVEANDPLLYTAARMLALGVSNKKEILELYERTRQDVKENSERLVKKEKLTSVGDIMSTVIPAKKPVSERRGLSELINRRGKLFSAEKNILTKKQPMGRMLSFGLAELMLEYDNLLVFGEDVGKKGGVYGVTQGLQKKFGANRVMDTLLDEQSILGLAIGLAHNGFIPIPEIQFLAYVHNAEDQIRGEASTLSFFSQGQFTNPMVIRIAGLAYQKGFGGHFHNDNSIAIFRDIPGVIVACPSNGADAVRLLRACVVLAEVERRVVIFLEPIAMYTVRDLYEKDDELWSSQYCFRETDKEIAFGELGIWGQGEELCIVSYGNGYRLSRQAAKVLLDEYNITLKVIDLRWLAPINHEALLKQINSCGSLLIVDECRRTGSVSEEIITAVVENAQEQGKPCLPMGRITAEDCFIPLADAANLLLPQKQQIVEAALALLAKR